MITDEIQLEPGDSIVFNDRLYGLCTNVLLREEYRLKKGWEKIESKESPYQPDLVEAGYVIVQLSNLMIIWQPITLILRGIYEGNTKLIRRI